MSRLLIEKFEQPKVFRNGARTTWHNEFGELHRDEDKPAVIYTDFPEGGRYWYKNGKLHRDEDKPAAIWHNKTKVWYKNDMRHRENGKPAVIYSDGTKEWWESDNFIKREGSI